MSPQSNTSVKEHVVCSNIHSGSLLRVIWWVSERKESVQVETKQPIDVSHCRRLSREEPYKTYYCIPNKCTCLAFVGLNMPVCLVVFGYVRLFTVVGSTMFFILIDGYLLLLVPPCFKAETAFVGVVCADFYYCSHKQAR